MLCKNEAFDMLKKYMVSIRNEKNNFTSGFTFAQMFSIIDATHADVYNSKHKNSNHKGCCFYYGVPKSRILERTSGVLEK